MAPLFSQLNPINIFASLTEACERFTRVCTALSVNSNDAKRPLNVTPNYAGAILRHPVEEIKEVSDELAGKPSCHYCWYDDQVRPDSDTRVKCASPRNSNTSLSATYRDVMSGAGVGCCIHRHF